MDWQAYATKVDADLETAEENNKQLKQEVRGLQKQLIEAKSDSKSVPTKSDPDVEHQLTQVQQEAKANKEKYIKHLNNLHGQLVDAGQARDAAVNQAAEAANDKRKIRRELEVTHTSLVKEHASNQQLRSQLTEQNRLLQQTRSQGTPAQMPSTQGAVSYQQRISVLERQLKIQQRMRGCRT